MVEHFNGRIEELLQSHHFHSGEELEINLNCYAALYNQQLPQSALGSNTPLQANKYSHNRNPDLFKKQPYHIPGCNTWLLKVTSHQTACDKAPSVCNYKKCKFEGQRYNRRWYHHHAHRHQYCCNYKIDDQEGQKDHKPNLKCP